MRALIRHVLETLAIAGTAGFAACASDSIVAPDRPAAPHSASHAASASAGGARYLVTFSNDIPSDFTDRLTALGGSVKYAHADAGVAVVQGLSDAAATTLAATSGVASVEADASVSIHDGTQSRTVAAPDALRIPAALTSPANPATAFFFGLGWQWNMLAIHADQAWVAGDLGSPSVTVSIIDTGIDYNSPDLAGLVDLSRSVSFVPSDDALTATLFPGVNPATDLNGHGTSVASVVASNALAFAGVTSRTRLMAVKTIGVDGLGFLGDIAAGILYSADHGADVANLSNRGIIPKAGAKGVPGRFLNRVGEYAFQRGMLLVAGAGNDQLDLDHDGDVEIAWCDLPHVICASATGPLTPTGSPDLFASSYSNFGTSAITVAAPGGNLFGPVANWPWGPGQVSFIWSLCSRTTVELDANGTPVDEPFKSGLFLCGAVGTSLATPHVTGLAALLAGVHGRIGPVELTNLITTSALDLGKPGRDPLFGWGRIDVARALAK
jgi:subtilisin family serine protease